MGSRKQLDQLVDELPSNQKRLRVIRQDRINVEDIDCYLEFGHTNYKVINLSPFGLLTQTDKQFTDAVIDANLVVDDVELGPVKLKSARQEVDLGGHQLVAFEVIGEPVSVDRVLAIRDSTGLIKDQEHYHSTTKRIPDAFARKVYEIKDWLEELQSRITEFESHKDKTDRVSYAEYENTVVQVMGDYLNRLIPDKNEELGTLIQDLNSEAIKICYEFFRAKLEKLIYQSPYASRAYYKPLGYAGDYELMNMIYRHDNGGGSLFAKCLNNYWHHEPGAQAVRNRANYVEQNIVRTFESTNIDGCPSILSVACGPAIEWQQIILGGRYAGREAKVDLLDQDEGALKHAQRRLKELSVKSVNKFRFEFIHKTIKGVLATGLDQKYDLIYSAGLFDYFSDPVAQLAAAKLYQALNPGGRLIIGNFNVGQPSAVVMDLALDWHLIYRTKEDLKKMYEPLGGKTVVECEPLNVNLFCVITKQ